ncbi:DUF262 domain-containing HNH endonuclease family protein [Flavobacterium sp. ASV13]|uniref:DUF262 domain-containing protein n=1 Tax=Flavobacterium sp. ASV13 TaxID=1506583 RepID=UPI00055841E8|nr:DUF262 domain-containing HNH endonuclease family protein [Flavobacterium sp. ASV13]
MSNFKNLKEYFSDTRKFVVPYYQRGYKWSLQKNVKRGDLHLSLLLQDFKDEFHNAVRDEKIIPNYEYYLQGITAKETTDSIELVDGQQRTTSLYILFCVLHSKGMKLQINLEDKFHYSVRDDANHVVQGFLKGHCDGDENIQDIAALKKAWNLCEDKIQGLENLQLFTDFIQENIKIIYIKLDENQDETKVFSMMNKDKAEMTQTDLVKSNLLREASRQLFTELSEDSNNEGLEWQVNQLRSKFAIEWDNWRKWWENKKHIEFCSLLELKKNTKDTEPGLVILCRLYIRFNKATIASAENGLFEYFKNEIANKDQTIIEAIEVFKKMRLLQNILQEWYNNVSIHNHLGLLFKGCGLRNKEERVLDLVQRYIDDKKNFEAYLKSEYIKEILDGTSKDDFIKSIVEHPDVYHNKYAIVARQLLRMNVMRTNKQFQKFDFSLYEEQSYNLPEDFAKANKRSLEHIKPQKYNNITNLSLSELEKLNSLTNTVGNLVLVPSGLNSKLSNESFEDKKELLFEGIINSKTKNYGLWLHTLSIFGSHTQWQVKEIEKNATEFKTEFDTFFK